MRDARASKPRLIARRFSPLPPLTLPLALAVNGPKPAEDAGSSSPINADGSYNFVGWHANYLLDPVTPFIMGYAFPVALGNCLPVLGTPFWPARMDSLSIASVRLPRVNNFALDLPLGFPALHAGGAFNVRAQGFPANPEPLQILVYTSFTGFAALAGPAPRCDGSAAIPLQMDSANAGHATIPASAALIDAPFILFVLTTAAVTVQPNNLMYLDEVVAPSVCGQGLAPLPGFALPPVLEGLQLAFLQLQRPPPAPPPAPPATPSASPSRSPSGSPSRSPTAPAASPSGVPSIDILIRETSGAARAAAPHRALAAALAAALLLLAPTLA